jgi:hypothetical protein
MLLEQVGGLLLARLQFGRTARSADDGRWCRRWRRGRWRRHPGRGDRRWAEVLRHLGLSRERRALALLGKRIVRGDREQPIVVGERPVELALGVVGVAARSVIVRRIRIEANRAAILADRAVEVAFHPVDLAAAEEGVRLRRIERDAAIIIGQRAVDVAGFQQRIGPLDIGQRVAGSQLDRLRLVGDRPRHAASTLWRGRWEAVACQRSPRCKPRQPCPSPPCPSQRRCNRPSRRHGPAPSRVSAPRRAKPRRRFAPARGGPGIAASFEAWLALELQVAPGELSHGLQQLQGAANMRPVDQDGHRCFPLRLRSEGSLSANCLVRVPHQKSCAPS